MEPPEEHGKSLGDELRISEGLQIAATGPTASGTLKIAARRVGWKASQEVDEVDTARRFSSSTGREWTIFEKQPQGSDVDVIGTLESRTREEKFQVTVLYDPEFWRSVNTRGTTNIELTCDDAIRLMEKAVTRKGNHYPLSQRQGVILLVDLVPGGMLAEFARETRVALASLLEVAAFKEVWVVGSTRDQVFQLWP